DARHAARRDVAGAPHRDAPARRRRDAGGAAAPGEALAAATEEDGRVPGKPGREKESARGASALIDLRGAAYLSAGVVEELVELAGVEPDAVLVALVELEPVEELAAHRLAAHGARARRVAELVLHELGHRALEAGFLGGLMEQVAHHRGLDEETAAALAEPGRAVGDLGVDEIDPARRTRNLCEPVAHRAPIVHADSR